MPELEGLLRRNGLMLPAETIARLEAYQAMLLEWNSRMDLTSVPPEETPVRHFLDALLPLAQTSFFSRHGKMIDVGTGAGFPGMAIAIACPDWQATLLEAQAEPRPGMNYPHVDSALLRDVPFVLSRADAYSTRVARRFFQENGIRPPIALTVQNTSDVLPAVAKAIGVSLLPSLPLGALGVAHKVTYLHVKTSEGRLQIGVMYRRDYVLNAVESAFVGILRQAYQEG